MDGPHLFELMFKSPEAKENCQFTLLPLRGSPYWGEPCGKNFVFSVLAVGSESGAKHSPPFLSARWPFGQKSRVLRIRMYLHLQLWNQSRFTWGPRATHNCHVQRAQRWPSQLEARLQSETYVVNCFILMYSVKDNRRWATIVNCFGLFDWSRRMHSLAQVQNGASVIL